MSYSAREVQRFAKESQPPRTTHPQIEPVRNIPDAIHQFEPRRSAGSEIRPFWRVLPRTVDLEEVNRCGDRP